MGVYIKEMKMPESCNKCPFTCEALQFFNGKDRPQRCPLIEIDDEEMNGLINLYKICKGASEVKSIQLKDIKPVVF